MILVQKHRKDVRIYDTEICTTICEGYGSGGGNIPMVITFCLDQQGGKSGANYQTEVSCTILSDSHGTPHAIAIIEDEESNTDGEKVF